MRKIIFFLALAASVAPLASASASAGSHYNTTVSSHVICDETILVSFLIKDGVVEISHITDTSEGLVSGNIVSVEKPPGTQEVVSVVISFMRVDGSTGVITGVDDTNHCGPPPTTTTTPPPTTTTQAPTTTVATTTTVAETAMAEITTTEVTTTVAETTVVNWPKTSVLAAAIAALVGIGSWLLFLWRRRSE